MLQEDTVTLRNYNLVSKTGEQQDHFALLEQVAKSVMPATYSDNNRNYSEEFIAYFAVYISLSSTFANCSVTSHTL